MCETSPILYLDENEVNPDVPGILPESSLNLNPEV
jgi:hypothetical protein